MQTPRIIPLNTGFISLDKGAYILPGKGNYGQEVTVPCVAFLVLDGDRKILVDTGMADTERADFHHPGSYQPEDLRIDRQIGKHGLKPGDITDIVFTHLHWDHCFHLEMFTSPRLYVHRKELEFALNPHILYYKSYCSEKLGISNPFKGREFITVDGEFDVTPNIHLFPTFGHCPGHQSVLVKTSDRKICIAGDAVFADENLEPDTHRGLPFTPNGRYVNVLELYDSMADIISRADLVLTSHGKKVLEHEHYE